MHSINLLDMHTLLMGNIVCSLVCSIVVALFWKQNHARFPATTYWLRGLSMECVALVLVIGRGSIPDFLSYIVSSGLIIGGVIQFYIGLNVYIERAPSRVFNYTLLFLFLLIQIHATYADAQPSILLRNINISAFLVLVCAQSAWVMWFRVPENRRPGTVVVGWVMATYCVLNIARTVLYVFFPPANDYFQAGYFEAFLLLAYQIMFFALTSSLLLMIIRQLYVELERDIERSRCSEAAVRLSEARLVRAEVASRSGNWELHLDTNEIVGSSGAAQVYGITADRIAYEEVKRLSLPEYRAMLDSAMIRLLRQQGPFDVEFRIRTADTGQIKDIHSVATYDPNSRVVFGIIQDISERKAVERKLERLVQIDMLTETFTRRQFMALAERELARAIRYASKTSVMMVDVDKFKSVNDTYGHLVGDRVLREIGLVFGLVLREADFVGRLGGEEFAVFLPETDFSQATEVAERLRRAVEQLSVPLADGSTLYVTVSIGIALFSGSVANIDIPLAEADNALYEAKRAGRNRVCLSDAALPSGV